VQIEIDRALYMDEREIRPHSGFAELRATLTAVMSEIVALARPAEPLPMAAE
jgi:N-formylglutamate amidohydrolase